MNITDFPTELHEHMALYMGLDAISFYATCKQIAMIDTEPFWRQLCLNADASYNACDCVHSEHTPDVIARSIIPAVQTYKQVCVYLRKIQLATRTDPGTAHVVAAAAQWPGASIRFIMNDMYTAHRHRFCMQGKPWQMSTFVKGYDDLVDIFVTHKMYWSLFELLRRHPSRSRLQYMRRGRPGVVHASSMSKADMISIVRQHANGVNLADPAAATMAFNACVTEFNNIIDGLRRNHDVTSFDFARYMSLYYKRRADVLRSGHDIFNYCIQPTREQCYTQAARKIADKLYAAIQRCANIQSDWLKLYGDELRAMLGAVSLPVDGPLAGAMLERAHALLNHLQFGLANLDAVARNSAMVKDVEWLVQRALIMVGSDTRAEKIRALQIRL